MEILLKKKKRNKFYVTNQAITNSIQLHGKYNIVMRIGLNKLEIKISQFELFKFQNRMGCV